MKTKDRILETALDQFNKNGSSKITTNHIAETMGISPGNLYYHFRNKEAIILKLWENMISEINIPFHDEATPEQGVMFILFLKDFFGIAYKYRFFWLEMAVLIGKDPILKEKYTTRFKRVLELYKINIYNWHKAGVFDSSIEPADLDQLIENTFFLSQFWVLYTHIHNDNITKESLMKGAGKIIRSIRPFLTPEIREMIDAVVADIAPEITS